MNKPKYKTKNDRIVELEEEVKQLKERITYWHAKYTKAQERIDDPRGQDW